MTAKPFALLTANPKVREYAARLEAQLAETAKERDRLAMERVLLTHHDHTPAAGKEIEDFRVLLNRGDWSVPWVRHAARSLFKRADAAEAELARVRERVKAELPAHGRCDPLPSFTARPGYVPCLRCRIEAALTGQGDRGQKETT